MPLLSGPRPALVTWAVLPLLVGGSLGDALGEHSLAVARTGAGNMPSDAAQIAAAFLLPYWVWGGLCGLFSIAVLALGTWLYLRPMEAT